MHCISRYSSRNVFAVLIWDPVLASLSFSHLFFQELKEILKSRGIDTSDCFEKGDLLTKVRSLL
jgi:hypothetical protein